MTTTRAAKNELQQKPLNRTSREVANQAGVSLPDKLHGAVVAKPTKQSSVLKNWPALILPLAIHHSMMLSPKLLHVGIYANQNVCTPRATAKDHSRRLALGGAELDQQEARKSTMALLFQR